LNPNPAGVEATEPRYSYVQRVDAAKPGPYHAAHL
jgi:hypothetical protein